MFGIVVEERKFRIFRPRPENARRADLEVFRGQYVIDPQITDRSRAIREITGIQCGVTALIQVGAALSACGLDRPCAAGRQVT